MTSQTLEAIYENGQFRPLHPPQLVDGQRVQLVIQAPSTTRPDDILAIAASVYEGFSALEIEAIEQMTHDRNHFIAHLPKINQVSWIEDPLTNELPFGIFADDPYFDEILQKMREERELEADNPAYT